MMIKTGVVAVASLVGLVLVGCGAGDDTGVPQAGAGNGQGGGCDQGEQSEAWQGGDRSGGAWQPATLMLRRRDDGAWQPPAGPFGVGEQSGVDRWAVEVLEVLSGQNDGAWQPSSDPVGVGEQFDLGDWTVEVLEIDYDATDEVEAAIRELGGTYDGTPIEGWTWVVADVSLTYVGDEEAASPEADLESRFVDVHGNVFIDMLCRVGSPAGEVSQGDTSVVSFGVPVPPGQVAGGLWGIAASDDPTIDDLTFVR